MVAGVADRWSVDAASPVGTSVRPRPVHEDTEPIKGASMRRIVIALVISALAVLSATAATADTTVKVSGNTVDTAAGENGSPGWWFNRDLSTATPYEFNSDEASIGNGSLYVAPIGLNPADKMVAEDFVFLPVADLQSIAYDYLIAGDGTTADAAHFYLNVYANIDDSDNYYDCRFDYVPTAPADLDDFATATVHATDTPTNVRQRGDRIASCPATLAGMPAGSHVRVFAINVGDSSANDAGLGGYLDNVVVTTTSGATTYDFEPAPVTKDDCKNGGYAAYGFSNQGQCVSSLQSSQHGGR